jgi:alpha-L-fucosidase
MRPFDDGRDWFLARRYGLFVHWGIYAIPAWHEQLQWRTRMRRSEYERFATQFNPTRFDPDAWLDIAEASGMESICITAKHHDGFCLWDTDQTDFKVTNTPYGRDIIGMLADACHRRSFPLRLYFSVVDWHHPNYPTSGGHHELDEPEAGDAPDRQRFMAFLRAQVEELCTRYGELHGFWWDMNTMLHHDAAAADPSINERIRELQPNAVINNRGFDDGDFGTPEREFHDPDGHDRSGSGRVEACQSVGSQSWGYREREDRYSFAHLAGAIQRYLAGGNNYLLNVGPRADGTIHEADVAMLRRIGGWLRRVRPSLYGVTPAADVMSDQSPPVTSAVREGVETLYVHVGPWPTSEGLALPGVTRPVARAVLLNTGERLDVRVETLPNQWRRGPCVWVRPLPIDRLAGEPLVVALTMAGS